MIDISTENIAVAVRKTPKLIPVFNEYGKQIGVWKTSIKVPFKTITLVNGIFKAGGNVLYGLNILSDNYDYWLSDNPINTGRYSYRMVGHGATIASIFAYGNPAGVMVGGTFYVGEMMHDSYKDETDPDRNPNTIHSLGEAKRNFGWFLNNLTSPARW